MTVTVLFACTYRTYEGPTEFNEAILSNYSEHQYADEDRIAYQSLENIQVTLNVSTGSVRGREGGRVRGNVKECEIKCVGMCVCVCACVCLYMCECMYV